MTLSTTTVRTTYTGSGSSGPFSFPFKITAASDLDVYKTTSAGAVSTLAYPTAYSVTGVGDAAGGSITLTVALASGETLAIVRDVPTTQPTSLRTQGTFLPESHEDALDRLTMIAQQQDDALGSAVRLAPSLDPATHSVTLTPETGKALVWQSSSTLGNSAIDSGAIGLPGSGRTVASTTAYLLNNAVYNVLDYGASTGASASVNAAAFQAAATAAGTDGCLLFPPGTFSSNGNLVILGPVMGDGCVINWSGTGDAICLSPSFNGVGNATLIQDHNIILPRITNTRKVGTGWAQTGVSGSVGVRVRHTYNSRIDIPYVSGFESGVMFYGEHDGTDYNNVRLGHIHNNKRNLVFDATTDGYANESVFLGGRLSHDPGEGVNVSGTRQILILGNVGGVTDLLNNHRFLGLSLEGDVPEYHVETKGSDCLWDGCRWETNLESPKFLSNGTNAMNNTVRGGQNAHNIVFTTTASGQQPRVESREGLTISGAGTNAVIKTANQNSSSSPIMRAYPAGTDLFGASIGTNWVWELTANWLKGKATGDATGSPRWQIDPTTGNITTKGGLASGLANVIANLDSSAFQQTIANTVTFTGPTMAAGIVFLWDSNSGHGAVVWVPNGNGVVITGTDNGSVYSGILTTGAKFNVAISSGALKIQNNSGASASMSGIVFKLA